MDFDEIVGCSRRPPGRPRAARGRPFRAAVVSTKYPIDSSIYITATTVATIYPIYSRCSLNLRFNPEEA